MKIQPPFLALANYLETLSSCLSGFSQHEETLDAFARPKTYNYASSEIIQWKVTRLKPSLTLGQLQKVRDILSLP